MRKLSTKTLAIGVGAFLSVFVLAGCSLFDSAKDLKDDKDAQKEFIDGVAEAMKDEKSFEITMKGKQGDEDIDMVIKIDGDNSEMTGKAQGQEMSMINLDGYSYITMDGTCYKTEADESASEAFDVDDLTEDFDGDKIDSGEIEYIGLEDVNGKKCYKYSYEEDGQKSYMWFDVDTKLPVKGEMEEDGATVTYEFNYKEVSIEAPEDCQDFSEYDYDM